MNTIKNIIHTYRWYFLFATLVSQFMGMVNLMNIAATYPEFNRSDLCAYTILPHLVCRISHNHGTTNPDNLYAASIITTQICNGIWNNTIRPCILPSVFNGN